MKKLIIGLGTGRCGTVSLSHFLNDQPGFQILHEGYIDGKHHLIKWQGDHLKLLNWIQTLAQRSGDGAVEYYGDIGMYFLPYVTFLIEKFPSVKFITLKRDRTEVINSYLEKTKGRNHWFCHDGTIWDKDEQWDDCYPKFDEPDKTKALGLYWDFYDQAIKKLEAQYPQNLACFNLESLNTLMGRNQILDFIGYQGERKLEQEYFYNQGIYNQGIQTKLPEFLPLYSTNFKEKQVAEMQQPSTEDKKLEQVAIVVTTHNRPHCLQRSLPQFVALGVPIVIVDDASTPENFQVNQALANQYQVPLIRIPENRGLPNAMNVGISYWLADPDIAWISYFQDDVDVHPDTLKILAKIQDPQFRPLLSGHHTPMHPTLEIQEIAGYRVKCKRSTNGLHLHGHRDYWCQVMPIPTPYLGAPKADQGKQGQGSDEDWWITCCSPNSITKRGGYVICIAGLVQTFMLTAEESTWGALNPELESKKL